MIIENKKEEDEVQFDHFVDIERTPQGKQDKTGKVKQSKNELHRHRKSLITEDYVELVKTGTQEKQSASHQKVRVEKGLSKGKLKYL